MASSETLLFVFSIIDGTALLFLTVYIIITLSDLECDYINARTCCDKLNKWVLVELVAFGSLCCALIFFNFHIFLFLLNLPLLVWLIYRYVTVPEGNTGAYDPTEIHNRLRLKSYMKEAMIKLTYHLIFFFIYLYSMIMALLA